MCHQELAYMTEKCLIDSVSYLKSYELQFHRLKKILETTNFIK